MSMLDTTEMLKKNEHTGMVAVRHSEEHAH